MVLLKIVLDRLYNSSDSDATISLTIDAYLSKSDYFKSAAGAWT
jgi:hypothetical protein